MAITLNATTMMMAAMIVVPVVLLLLLTLTLKLMASRYDRIFVSLPYSHFVEAARWAMERRGLRVWEIKVPIGPHVIVANTFRTLYPRGSLSSTSSFPGQAFEEDELPYLNSRRMATLPLVIQTQTETCLPDSWGVLADCQFSVQQEIRERWDQDLGPSVRQAAYYYIFQDKKIYREIQSCNAFWMFFHDFFEWAMNITRLMEKMMFMTPKEVEKAEERIQKEFELVSSILDKHKYLGDGTGSDTFGGADIAFSALAGWLVFPENFHSGNVNIPDKQTLPTALKELMKKVEPTKAAKHIHHCYKLHRQEVIECQPKKEL